MPQPPSEKPASGRSANPARIMLNSPLAAATRARAFRKRTRERPRERLLRTFAALGALVLHLLFLFGFVLGSAYQVKPPHASKEPQLLQVRLIEPPEPPPPPPVRGTPPKERGPRHQGRRSSVVPTREVSANAQAITATRPPPAPAKPVVAKAAKPRATVVKPVAAPKPPIALPQPAPTPDLQPIPLPSEPPAVTLAMPALKPPVPPRFQPEAVRPPQVEGNQPMPPPPSLAMPDVPPEASPPITISSIALNTELPKSTAPASITLAQPKVAAAPPVPELQAVPLPAQQSPSVNLQAELSPPAPTTPQQQPQIQAPTVEVAEAELEAVPISPASAADTLTLPKVKIDVADSAPTQAIQPSIQQPTPSPPATAPAAAPAPSPTSASEPATAAPSVAAKQPAAAESAPKPGDVAIGRDVSTAPDATPQGSDSARPGQPQGVTAEVPNASAGEGARTARQPAAGKAGDSAGRGRQQGKGQPGGDQAGADQGKKQGAIGTYVQLKPQGDTDIMTHSAPNIGYKPTRFEQDWTPEGESSIDTALRRAVEKTTTSHTFQLPRGVRIECSVKPLLPIALFSCHNPDPPPKPVDAKVYEKLDLAPANPLVPPEPAATVASPAPMVPVDNSAECAAARVAGAPPPPGCQSLTPPAKLVPASSSSSWVPASDQFH